MTLQCQGQETLQTDTRQMDQECNAMI
jgi:hypothetical protein